MNQTEMNEVEEKIEVVFNHIQNVQRSTYRLGIRLIKKGEIEFVR